jgi:hypothetical protein
MLKTALTIANLPGQLTLRALQSIATPASINALSVAIAQGSIETAQKETAISTEGLSVEIEYNEERLLTTGGISTALALGTVYWMGNKLNLQVRMNLLVQALEGLKLATRASDTLEVEKSLRLIDDLTNPLIDPTTLKEVDAVDEVKVVYQQLFNKPAAPGALFNTKTFTATVDDAIRLGSRAGTLLAISQTDEAIEAMIKRAKPIAGKAVGRIVGGVLWVDTVWWLATSAIDIGLDFLGIPEDKQRIPILADIPIIGGLFDFSDGLGSSAVDLLLAPLLDGIFSLFELEDEVEVLTDALWSIITSAALSPTLLPLTLGILEFYVESISISVEVSALFDITTVDLDVALDLFKYRPEPLDVLVLWLYAITGKIIFQAWVKPAYNVLIRRR